MKKTKQRLKDYALYVEISTLIIGAIFAALLAGMSWNFFVKKVGFAVVTAILFGLFIQNSRTLLQQKSFWIFLTLFFFLHCVAWIAILARVEHWKFVWFYPILLEVLVFQILRSKLLSNSRSLMHKITSCKSS